MRFKPILILLSFLGLILLASCDPEERKFQQFYSYGQIVYESDCASCHGLDGNSVLPIIPPLANADYMFEDTTRTMCIIKYGMSGLIEVNGRNYNMRMPAANSINNVEIAYLMTYLYARWNDESSRVFDPAEIDSSLNRCASYELNILN